MAILNYFATLNRVCLLSVQTTSIKNKTKKHAKRGCTESLKSIENQEEENEEKLRKTKKNQEK